MTKPASPIFELNDFQRVYFEFLREHLPEIESDEELARLIMSKGLFALLKEQKDRIPTEKRAMAPKPLPEHYRIILEPDELTALEQIYEVQPWWRDPLELLHMVIREGLKAMNRAGASKRDPTEPTRSEIEVRREVKASGIPRSARPENPVVALLYRIEAGDALSRQFPARLTIELTPAQQDALREIADREPHASDEQLLSRVISVGLESMKSESPVPLTTNADGTRAKRARHKELANEVSLEDRLRKKLTKFRTHHPEAMGKDDRKLLADLGTHRRSERPGKR